MNRLELLYKIVYYLEDDVKKEGRWTVKEHNAFLFGIQIFINDWRKISKLIPSRTLKQIRSHNQKYRSKLKKRHKFIKDQKTYYENKNGNIIEYIPCIIKDIKYYDNYGYYYKCEGKDRNYYSEKFFSSEL